jgi:cardiolipin synthase A/B
MNSVTPPAAEPTAQPMLQPSIDSPQTETGGVICQQVTVAGQSLTLFESSSPLIEAMVADIRAARRRVWMETYIFAADRAGESIAEALSDRAAAGLDVRLMYDAVGSVATPAAIFAGMQAAGVKVHVYHGFREALRRFGFFFRTMNRRNHRKLLIVDDEIGYFGGMNVVDQSGMETVDDVKARNLPISAGWRDVHVRLIGPQQRELTEIMQRLWKRAHHNRVDAWPRWPVRQMLAAKEDGLWFFDTRPTFKNRRAHRMLVPLIRRAEHDITVSMAYFIPIGRVLRELTRARRRGVKIRVVIPGQSDVRAVQWATRYFYKYLLSRGFHIYERKDLMLHSKVMVIDGRYSVIGSCNLDPRSLRLNLEFLAVGISRKLAAGVLKICRFEMRNSRRVRLEDYLKRTWSQRLLDRTAWALRRWL